MRLTISTIFSDSMEKSLVNSFICHVSSAPTPAIVINSTNKQMMTASTLGTFLFSIHLQNGKNSVAKIPAIHKGMRNPFAKYSPAITKNKTSSFFTNDEVEIIILCYLFNTANKEQIQLYLKRFLSFPFYQFV